MQSLARILRYLGSTLVILYDFVYCFFSPEGVPKNGTRGWEIRSKKQSPKSPQGADPRSRPCFSTPASTKMPKSRMDVIRPVTCNAKKVSRLGNLFGEPPCGTGEAKCFNWELGW